MDDRPRLRPDLAPLSAPGRSILLLLGIGVRFIHHALFDGTMFTLQYYVVDTIVLLIIGIARLPIHPHQPDGDAISLALRKGFAAELEAERAERSPLTPFRG